MNNRLAQAEAQLAQQQQEVQTASSSSGRQSSSLDMTFDWLELGMPGPVADSAGTTTTGSIGTTSRQSSTTLLSSTSPIIGADHPFARGLLPPGILGEHPSDIDMADAFLTDAHADWYARCASFFGASILELVR
jgi:hypothetical protein